MQKYKNRKYKNQKCKIENVKIKNVKIQNVKIENTLSRLGFRTEVIFIAQRFVKTSN